MSRPRRPETTLERRISRVLSSIAPLTPAQIIKAVYPTDKTVVYATLNRLHRRGVLSRVSSSAAQRYANGGCGNAYALVGR